MNAIPIYYSAYAPSRLRNIFRWLLARIGTANSVAARRSGYDEAVRSYGSLIDRLCFGYARTASDFDDLRQDVLMNLWLSMPKFQGDCSMKSWVYRLTLNVCVSSLRKSYRRIHTVELTELYDMVDGGAEQKETLSELHEAISCLNPLDKAIMILWLEEEPYDEIARITGLSRANVATRIHRAKQRLKSIIER